MLCYFVYFVYHAYESIRKPNKNRFDMSFDTVLYNIRIRPLVVLNNSMSCDIIWYSNQTLVVLKQYGMS